MGTKASGRKAKRTFGEASDAYRAMLHAEGRLTMDTERRLATFAPRWRNIPLDDITPEDVHNYFRRKFAGRKSNTIGRNMGTFNAILNMAVDMGWSAQKIRVKRPRGSRKDERIAHLEAEEVMPLVQYITRTYGALMGFTVLLLIDTGLRFGEALRLRWCDLGEDWVLVRPSDYEFSKTKPRRIPTSPRLLQFMNVHGILPEEGIDPRLSIMANLYNKAPTAIGRELRAALKEATHVTNCLYADMDMRPHDLRHTFAYLCAKSGADIGDIRELMGHSNIAMTMRYRGFIDSKAKDIIRRGMKE